MNARWASTLVIWLDAPSSHHYHACMLAVQEEIFSSIITTAGFYRMRYFGGKTGYRMPPMVGPSTVGGRLLSLSLSRGDLDMQCNGEGMCCVACRPAICQCWLDHQVSVATIASSTCTVRPFSPVQPAINLLWLPTQCLYHR
jgi:hypothetical protein